MLAALSVVVSACGTGSGTEPVAAEAGAGAPASVASSTTAPDRSAGRDSTAGPVSIAAPTTGVPEPSVELLPAGTAEVATVRAELASVTVRALPPATWDDRTDDVVRSDDARPPRSALDVDRVALPSAEVPVPGREVAAGGWRFANPTTYDPPQPLTFGVVQRRGDWVQVQLPVRPNGTSGWLHQDEVELTRTTRSVHVSLGERRLRVLDAGIELLSVPTAIGRPASPTPTGTFTVTDLVPSADPAGSYGPIALALDGHSEVMDAFPSENAAGAPDETAPVLAIHGTNRPASVGQAASNGCPRLTNADVLRLAQLAPAGTPVFIWP